MCIAGDASFIRLACNLDINKAVYFRGAQVVYENKKHQIYIPCRIENMIDLHPTET